MTTDPNTILSASDLHKSYGSGRARNHVLHGLDLSVRRGEFLAVMGPSGCGKSTLLHVLGLMTPPDEGTVHLDGALAAAGAGRGKVSEAVRRHLRAERIGFVFQRFNLLSVLTGDDNVRVSLKVRGRRMDARTRDLFEAMGVAHVAGRKPAQMSIGEQQRVAVVRALAHRPALLLADEPTGNLDSAASDALLDLLRRINEDEGQTIVMITHSAEAAGRADRTVYMKDGRLADQPD